MPGIHTMEKGLDRAEKNAKIYLKENPDIALEIENKIRSEKDQKDEEVQEDNERDSQDVTDNEKGNKEINVD